MLCKNFISLDRVREIDEILSDTFEIKYFESVDIWSEHFSKIHRKITEFDKISTQLARKSEKTGMSDERRLMTRMADYSVNGAIVSHRNRHITLDQICFTASVIQDIDITGSILDIGCHNGVTPIVLGMLYPNQIRGFDPCIPAINNARSFSKKLDNVSFEAGALPVIEGDHASLVTCFDVINHVTDEMLPNCITNLCSLVERGGYILLTSKMLRYSDIIDIINTALSTQDVGFVSCDVLGGFGKIPPEFESEMIIMLKKDGYRPIPSEVHDLASSEWDLHFKHYANNKRTLNREKTQSFGRAIRYSA